MPIDRAMVVIGDPGVGKTCLLTFIGEGRFPYSWHSQVVYGGHPKQIYVDGRRINLGLWDPSGIFMNLPPEVTEEGRQARYSDSAVVVICFAIDNPDSLRSIAERWYLEVRHFSSAPILLVGCKGDLRDPKRAPRKDDETDDSTAKMVTNEQARLVASNIDAVEYLECSAIQNQGVEQVVQSAARIAASWDPRRPLSERSTCQIV